LTYVNGQVFAEGNVIRSDSLQPLLRFVYNSTDVGTEGELIGELFIEARSSSFLDRLINAYSWRELSIQDVDASGRAWVTLSGLSVDAVYGDIQLHKLNWNLGKDSLAPLTNATLRFNWNGNQHGHRIDLYGLKYRWKEHECSIPGAVLDLSSSKTEVAIKSIDLSCVSNLLLALELSEGRLAQRLEISQPHGRLKDLWLTIDSDSQESFELSAMLERVGVKAFEGTPAIFGVDGFLYTNSSSGFVEFDSDALELSFPTLYLEGWLSDRASGRVTWRDEGDDFIIESEGLSLRVFGDSEVFGDFFLSLNDDEHEDYLGLMLGMRNVELSNVTKLVPFYEVNEDLYTWLGSSLVSGRVYEGMFFAYGSVDDNTPDNSFSTALRLNTRGATLNFDPSWPHVTDLNIDLSLHQDHLVISAQDAKFGTADLKRLDVFMPGTKTPDEDPTLSLGLDVHMAGDEYQYWLTESPIADDTKELADLLTFSGPSTLGLDLALVLNENIDTEFELDVEALGMSVQFQDSHLNASDVRGKVSVSSLSGVTASDVTMQFLGHPATLKIEQNPFEKLTEATLDGRFSMEALSNTDDAWSYGLKGSSSFSAALDIPQDDTISPELRLKTNMRGIDSNWPEPLAKKAGDETPVEVVAIFKPKQTNVQFNVTGEALPETEGELLFIDGAMEYGRIAASASNAQNTLDHYLYTDDGLGISIAAEHVNVEDWVNYITQSIPSQSSDEDDELFNEIRVKSASVDVFDAQVSDAEAAIYRENTQTKIYLTGPNTEGTVLVTDSEMPLAIDLKKLYVDKLSMLDSEADGSQSKQGDKPEPAETEIDPRELISMSLNVADLRLSGAHWGALRFWTETDELGVIFRDLQVNAHGSQLEGQLNWQYDQGQSHTILTLEGQGENIEPILGLFGQQSPLSSDEYTADLALVWPDTPQNFSLAKSSGRATLEFEDGVISTDSNATGALRVFGIFSLDALSRRLRLDFSDLYKSGISYDLVDFNGAIDQGDLKLVDPLVIDGPSSKYTLNGNIDLEAQTLDLKMLLELPISSNAPIAGLLLGNPAVGGAVWLVDKILGEPLSRLASVRYSLKGSWENPEIKLEKSSDDR